MTAISKTTYTFVVLHLTADAPRDLQWALEESKDRLGTMIGAVVNQSTAMLPDPKVNDELRSLGDDGTFFDNELEADDRT